MHQLLHFPLFEGALLHVERHFVPTLALEGFVHFPLTQILRTFLGGLHRRFLSGSLEHLLRQGLVVLDRVLLLVPFHGLQHIGGFIDIFGEPLLLDLLLGLVNVFVNRLAREIVAETHAFFGLIHR